MSKEDMIKYLTKRGWREGMTANTVCRDHPHGKVETRLIDEAYIHEKQMADFAAMFPKMKGGIEF